MGGGVDVRWRIVCSRRRLQQHRAILPAYLPIECAPEGRQLRVQHARTHGRLVFSDDNHQPHSHWGNDMKEEIKSLILCSYVF